MRAGRRAGFRGAAAAGLALLATAACVGFAEGRVARGVAGVAAPARGLEQRLGRLIDAESGAPIPGAIVTWSESGRAGSAAAIADADGWFAPDPAWGPGGTVQASALGYRVPCLRSTAPTRWGAS